MRSMSTAHAPASLVAAVRRAKDAYLAGGEITILEMTVLRIYFKRVLDSKRSSPGVILLRAQVDKLLHPSDVAHWLDQARSIGIYVFGLRRERDRRH